MNISDLTANQLARAASIKQKIDDLTHELNGILNGDARGNGGRKRSRLSPGARQRIAAAQKARWAKLRKAKAAKPAVKSAVKKTKMSAAARARASARMKKFWAAKKAGKKTAGSRK